MSAERFPIEAGHIKAFARAIGDFNPVYHDAGAAAASEVGGVIAPPTFVQASAHFDDDYPLRPRPGVRWFDQEAPPRARSGPVAGATVSGARRRPGVPGCTPSSTTPTTDRCERARW